MPKNQMPSKKVETEKLTTPAFKALADATRLKILLMLEGKPRTVGEIVNFFDLSQPTISRHLQTLTSGGLTIRKRAGQQVYYEVNPEKVRNLCLELAACFPCCCVTITPFQTNKNKSTGECCSTQQPVKRQKNKATKSTRKKGVKS